MDYTELLDLKTLLLPISEALPTGTDPRQDISPTSRYYTLKDIRSQTRANERAALVDDENVQSLAADWLPIIEQIPQALATESKDLEYVAWLIEALCRTSGFRGLAAGFCLAQQLIQQQWNHLYPHPDEDGMETRIAPLIGLNGYEGEGALITPIISIPITEFYGENTFATWQYNRAADIALMDEEKQRKRSDEGIANLSQIEAAVKASSPQFYVCLIQDIQSAIDEFAALSDAMDAAMDGVPQPTSSISKSLKKCQDAVNHLAGDMVETFLLQQRAELSEPGKNAEINIVSAQSVTSLDSQMANRNKAVRQLRDVANYFRQAEPHSPMSYAIDQVVRWSELALPELLKELIDEDNSRTQFFRLTGIPLED